MMMLKIVALLLVICLKVHCGGIPMQENFDAPKYLGKWFGVAAASNCSVFQSMRKGMTMPTVFYSMVKSQLQLQIAYITPKGCKGMKAIYETITPGHYKFSARGENEVIIIGTDYDHFGLEYTRRVSENEVTVTVKLFGRQTDLPEAVLNKFKEMCKALGLKDDLIVILPKGVECDPTKV